MNATLTCNVTTGDVTEGDGTWTPRAFVFGEALVLSLRTVQNVEGVPTEQWPVITAIKAAVGAEDARPLSGRFALQVGTGASTADNTTETLSYNANPSAVAAALNAVAALRTANGVAEVTGAAGAYTIVFGDGAAELEITIRENTLRPLSRAVTAAYQIDERWIHEVRLTQAQVAFKSLAPRKLPPPPSIVAIADGSTNEQVATNEIQNLIIPAEYRGGYYLQTVAGARTVSLGRSDTATTIKAALEGVFGKGNIDVSDLDATTAQIVWQGAYGGVNMDTLEVVPINAPPGDLQLIVNFDSAELWALIRSTPGLTVPFEIWIWKLEREEGSDPIDGEVATPVVLVRQPLSFLKPITWPSDETLPLIDWIRPLNPKDYQSFSADTVLVGGRAQPWVMGDGVLVQFNKTHGYGTKALTVILQENFDGGRELVLGTDYALYFMTVNAIRVVALLGTPSPAGWVAFYQAADTVATFAEGLHVDIDQVNGLATQLATLGTAVSTLQTQAASGTLGTVVVGQATAPIVIGVKAFADAFPGSATISGLDVDPATAQAGALLPALHTTSVTSIGSGGSLPSITTAAGHVYQNNSGGALRVNGGGGSLSSTVAVGEYVAGDGRRVYPVTKVNNSFFPRDFERFPFFSFAVNPQMLRAGTTLRGSWLQTLYTLLATSRVKCECVVEIGVITSDASPSPTQDNLAAITWNTTTPLLRQSLLIDGTSVQHPFGFKITRMPNGDLAADKVIYNFASGADFVPATAKFEVRGRLINFDTENSAANARGLIVSLFDSPSFQIQ